MDKRIGNCIQIHAIPNLHLLYFALLLLQAHSNAGERSYSV